MPRHRERRGVLRVREGRRSRGHRGDRGDPEEGHGRVAADHRAVGHAEEGLVHMAVAAKGCDIQVEGEEHRNILAVEGVGRSLDRSLEGAAVEEEDNDRVGAGHREEHRKVVEDSPGEGGPEEDRLEDDLVGEDIRRREAGLAGGIGKTCRRLKSIQVKSSQNQT